MLSLMLGLDLLRPLWRQQSKLTRIVLLGPISMSLPEISIGFSGANPTPFSENTNTPIVERLFVILFWRYLSCHRYPSFYFYAGQVGKKKKSAHLFVIQPFIILFSCYRLSLPFLSVFLFSCDAAWIRWFWVFVGFKNGARWGCIFFWSPLLVWDYCGHFCRVNYSHGISPTCVVWPRG